MKATVAGLILLASLGAYAQGTVLFANFDAGTRLNAPVFRDDGVTPLSAGYTVGLLAGPTDTNLQLIATTNFLTGAQAGYFNGGVQSISNVVGGGVASILIAVWATTYGSLASAQAAAIGNAWGWSSDGSLFGPSPFQIKTGNPAGTPATPTAVLTPLATFFLQPTDNPLQPPVVYQSYNPINGSVTLSFIGWLQSSTNLINWTSITNSSPQTFPAVRAQQYFRARVTAAGP